MTEERVEEDLRWGKILGASGEQGREGGERDPGNRRRMKEVNV
jgi:hypothetical protein